MRQRKGILASWISFILLGAMILVVGIPRFAVAARQIDSSLSLSAPELPIHISPDSQRVVYMADKDGNNAAELYSAPVTGGAVVQLSPAMPALSNSLAWLE